MAAETPVEALARKAKEQAAQTAAADAQKKADESAAADPKIAESKRQQEAEEIAADLQARTANAANLIAANSANAAAVGLSGGVPGVTPNAGAAPLPLGGQMARTDEIPLSSSFAPVADLEVQRPWRTFQHLYANANTVLPNGKKIIFGGQNGHIGQYSTNKEDQIEHLADLANTPGSMVTEVRKDADGRYIVVTDAILEAEKQAALIDSRTNTARQQDPGVAQAMNNLGRTIAQDS